MGQFLRVYLPTLEKKDQDYLRVDVAAMTESTRKISMYKCMARFFFSI